MTEDDIKLDDLMSGDGEAVIEQQDKPSDTNRDEKGRFAAAQAEADLAADQEGDQGAQEPVQEQQEQGQVPVAALQAERAKTKQEKARADELHAQIATLSARIDAMAKTPQQAPKPTEQEQPASLWEDPDGYLKSQLTPVQQQMVEMREFISENLAVQSHGAETVNAAKAAIEQVAQTPEGQRVIAEIMQSRHPYDDLVKWHRKQQTLSQVGDDPNAWLEAELEKRLADPTYQAKVLERIRGSAASNTSRSQPSTSMPPSLSRLPAGGNQPADTDMSDAALFQNALR